MRDVFYTIDSRNFKPTTDENFQTGQVVLQIMIEQIRMEARSVLMNSSGIHRLTAIWWKRRRG